MDWLIPPPEYAAFLSRVGGTFSRDAVVAFAARIGRQPGVVVGRLQWEGLLPYTHLNGLKAKVSAHLA
ncbi:MAG: hypothetical protein HYU66_02005 [Armatimonadetes bacterium]|nr:hypothetical protein [Armatimonadota bacterium]